MNVSKTSMVELPNTELTTILCQTEEPPTLETTRPEEIDPIQDQPARKDKHCYRLMRKNETESIEISDFAMEYLNDVARLYDLPPYLFVDLVVRDHLMSSLGIYEDWDNEERLNCEGLSLLRAMEELVGKYEELIELIKFAHPKRNHVDGLRIRNWD